MRSNRFLLRLPFAGSLVLAAVLLSWRNAAAQVDPWEFEVYPYATESRGVLDIETDNAAVPNGHRQAGSGTSAGIYPSQSTWYNQFELTYGLSDRIEAAAYLNLALPRGGGYQYAGSKYRLRGRLFDEDVLPVNLGWYLELEWRRTPQFDEDQLEVELRPIIEKDFGPFSLIANPIFEKPIFVGPDRNRGFQFGYAGGAYYRWTRILSPGIETYGETGRFDEWAPAHEQQHYIFPVAWGELPHGLKYSIGPGFGLTRGSDHVLVKFNLEIERFIGSTFGASPDGNWFF